jgi:CBS domain-containing protein
MTPVIDLDILTVADVMHAGVVTCSAAADLGEVAEAMAEHAIHGVVAIDEGPPGEDDDRLWGVVSDLDLLRGLRSPMDLDAGNLADLDVATVEPGDSLAVAADAMLHRGVAHLVVVTDGRPVGVLSTLDIARAVRSARRAAGQPARG